MKPLKSSALKELSAGELEAKLKEARENFFKLKLRKETRQMDDLVSVRIARRDISRILTFLQKKKTVPAKEAAVTKKS